MIEEDPDAIWRSDDVAVRPAIEFDVPGGDGSPVDRVSSAPPNLPIPSGNAPRTRRAGTLTIAAGTVAAVLAIGAVVAVVADDADEAAPVDTSAEPTASSVADEEPVDSTVTTEVEPGTTSVGEVELPPAVARVAAPTELVVLTQAGLLHTLSLPSGRLHTVDLAGVSEEATANGFRGIVVAPDATAVAAGMSSVTIVPRIGDALEVDVADNGVADGSGAGLSIDGWVRADDGTTRFVVTRYPVDGSNFSRSLVAVDGTVTALPANFVATPMGGVTGLNGSLIVNDAGGAYRVSGDGAFTRIEDGAVLASGPGHRLVRNCDPNLNCTLEVVADGDGTRREIDPAVLPDDFGDNTYNLELAPDGSAVAMVRGGNQQQRVIVDFDTGEVGSARSDLWTQGTTWAADSSGIFDVAAGELQFVDRVAGEAVVFGDTLGPIMGLGVRHPDAELAADAFLAPTMLSVTRPFGPTGLFVSTAKRSGGVGVLAVDQLALTTWEAPTLGPGAATVHAVGDAVLALPSNDAPAYLTTPGAVTMLGEPFRSDQPILPGPAPDTFWVADEAATERDVRRQLFRLDGTPADDLGDARIDVTDAALLGSDGTGALVVARRGDIYIVGVDGTSHLTAGELIAIGASTAYVRECDSIPDCRLVRIDRVTGSRQAVTLDPALTDTLIAVEPARGPALGSTVSPDGEVLVSAFVDAAAEPVPGPRSVVVDLATQATISIEAHLDSQPFVWNSDSSYAALVAGLGVHVYDRRAVEIIELSGARIRTIGPAPAPAPAPAAAPAP